MLTPRMFFKILIQILLTYILFQPAPSAEMWQWVHSFYGEELGLTSDDEPDYVSPFGVTPSSSTLLVRFSLLLKSTMCTKSGPLRIFGQQASIWFSKCQVQSTSE